METTDIDINVGWKLIAWTACYWSVEQHIDWSICGYVVGHIWNYYNELETIIVKGVGHL